MINPLRYGINRTAGRRALVLFCASFDSTFIRNRCLWALHECARQWVSRHRTAVADVSSPRDWPSDSGIARGFNAAGRAGMLGAIALMGVVPFLWTVHQYPLTTLDSELVAVLCLAAGLVFSGLLGC